MDTDNPLWALLLLTQLPIRDREDGFQSVLTIKLLTGSDFDNPAEW